MGRRRRLDVAPGGEDEGNALGGEPVGDGPYLLPIQIDVDDRDVEAPLLDPTQRVDEIVAGGGHLVAQRIEKILEHHRDKRFVFDDEDGAAAGHGESLKARRGDRKPLFDLRMRRRLALPADVLSHGTEGKN